MGKSAGAISVSIPLREKEKKWLVSAAPSTETAGKIDLIATELGINPIIASLLYGRGYTTPVAAKKFLYMETEVLSDSFGIKDMDKAAKRVQQAIDSGELICVYGDYDADGVTSTALLYSYLETVGANVIYYIPSRENEGYGMNTGAVDTLAEKGVKVAVSDLARCDMHEAVEDAFRYSHLVLATTTYNADVFPFMRDFIDHLTERNFSNRTVALIENGSWAPMAAKVMKDMFEKSKNLTFAETIVTLRSALNEQSRAQVEQLGEELCRE